MAVEELLNGLSERDRSHLKYLRGLALQPLDSWEGFYRTPNESMNFALRFQIAFAGYALYGLARRTPAYRQPYAEALKALIERMLRAETWAYWLNAARHSQPQEEEKPGRLQSAVDLVHSRLGLGGNIPADPCQQGNIQYSGHLSSLLGFYEMLTGADDFDREGVWLRAEADGQRFEFHYTHNSLAEHLHAQMQESHFGGVCCEPGRAYVACNNHICISNVLHDQLHGTRLAEANGRWAEWVEKRMLTGGRQGKLPLPAPNGLLSVAYMPDLHMPIPVSFNLTDAWGLAFMAAWQPELVEEVYPRLRRRLKLEGAGQLYLESRSPNESLEISSRALNTAFAAVLAREMGDTETFQALQDWADANLSPLEDEISGRYYAARPAPYVTALLALARTLPENGKGLYNLLRWRPDFTAPALAEVSPGMEVSQAEWTGKQLHISLTGKPGTAFSLRLENCPAPELINFDGVEIGLDSQTARYEAASKTLQLSLGLTSASGKLLIE
jgi:hypothetical protein